MTTEPTIIRASSLGGCTKAIAATILGYPAMDFPEKFSGYMAEGDLHEGAIVKDLENGGFLVVDSQREVDLWIIPGVLKVQGHIDGRFRHLVPAQSPFRLLEIKTMGDASYKQFASMRMETPGLVQKYKWQISTYMLALGEPCTLIVKNRNTGERISIEIEEPYYSLGEIRSRVLEIYGWCESGTLPERCEEIYPCPYHYLHPPKETGLANAEIVELASEYRTIERRLAENKVLKEIQDELKLKLIAAMGKDTTLETPDGKVRVTRWSQKNPPRFDKEKAVQDGIDVSKYMTQGESARLKVTVREDEDG